MYSKANTRALRTIIQFILGGGLTALITLMSDGLGPKMTGVILAIGTVCVTWVQNYAEDHELLPVLFPSKLDKK